MTRLYVEPNGFRTPASKWADSEVVAESSDPRIPVLDSSRLENDQADASRDISSCFPTLCLPREGPSVSSLYRNEQRTMNAVIHVIRMIFVEADILVRQKTLEPWKTRREQITVD